MKQVTVIVIGAGDRGTKYAAYALKHPYELKIVGIAEPDEKKRKIFAEEHNIPSEYQFTDFKEIFARNRFADAVIIATQDNMHYEPAKMALDKKYHILLEKPMSNKLDECVDLTEYAKNRNKIFMICHVLRYTPFFSTIKNILDAGKLGEITTIQHNENIGYIHFSHSYVRGNWRNKEESSPIILAKSCHDMDLLLWLIGDEKDKCKSISSFGNLSYFKKENKPKGSPSRCIDGCPVEKDCPYSAIKIYLGDKTTWPVSVISSDLSFEGRMKAVKEGPYGRCVFSCDNNVPDHQVTILEFESGKTVAFTLSALTDKISRTIKIMGTKAQLRGDIKKNEIEIFYFNDESIEVINPGILPGGHSGGDTGLMRNFVAAVRNNNASEVRTSIETSLNSHLMAFAAEEARVTKQVVDFFEFSKRVLNDK